MKFSGFSTAAFQASTSARMKLLLAGPVKRLNVESSRGGFSASNVQHRTSNIDDDTLYRF
jgi:hypothetical protein